MHRHPDILDRKRCGLLVVDIQEKILAVMNDPERVVAITIKLIEGFKILNLPVVVTEQYPEGIGPTVDPIKKALGDVAMSKKMTFSCCGIEDFTRTFREKDVDQVVVCGIESHVCVWQTAMDLLNEGFLVHVVRDAVSSRKIEDMNSALLRMTSNGIQISTSEMVLFELLEQAGTDEFKRMMKLIK